MRTHRSVMLIALFAVLSTTHRAFAIPTDEPPFPGATPEHSLKAAHAAARAGRSAEALRQYLVAAEGIPDVADWLLRRAALLTADSAGRATLYARIRLPLVRAHLLETEAQARERYGDPRGAAVRYDSLGRVVDAARVRLGVATSAAERRALTARLVEYIGGKAGTTETQAAADLIFAQRLELPPAEALTVARACARTRGQAARAAVLFPRAISAGLATPEDRMAFAGALAQLGRHREAIAVWAGIPAGSAESPAARLQQAQSFSRLGQSEDARRLLQGLAADGSDAASAGRALFLLADLRWRSGDSARARNSWLELVHRFPHHDDAGRGGFLAGLLSWEQGESRQAADEWERVHLLDGGGDGQAAGYWAGRAYERVGELSHAQLLWQSVIARDSLSYYAVASARRLGVASWAPKPAPERFRSYRDLDSTAARLATLRSLALSEELGWEIQALLTEPSPTTERLLATASLLRGEDQSSAAVALARRALRAGAPQDARTYRLLFPLLHPEELRRNAVLFGLDVNLVAALIRQESAWNAAAKSRVGALGLMQVMPATGREIARSLGVSGWKPERLLDPGTNLRFGSYYLSLALRRYDGDHTRALASYNAGAGRIGNWATGPAATDPELFVERITIQETRDYVRIIQRNIAMYRTLYGASPLPGPLVLPVAAVTPPQLPPPPGIGPTSAPVMTLDAVRQYLTPLDTLLLTEGMLPTNPTRLRTP